MIAAIIQARVSSTRLPKKVLLPLGDTTVLGSTVRQLKKAKRIDRVIVATSTEREDDAIASHCAEIGVECCRGSLNDVLDRYYLCAKSVDAETIVRITADCPVIDPDLIDLVVEEFNRGKWDYVSNGKMESTYPDGMDVEVFSFGALESAWKEAKFPSEREHVTPYIWKHPERFRVHEIKTSEDLRAVRITIDEPEDYEVLKEIVADVQPLSLAGIVRYLREHPEVVARSAHLVRNEGYLISLDHDKKAQH